VFQIFKVKFDPYPWQVTFQNQQSWESKLEDGSFAVSQLSPGPKNRLKNGLECFEL
jgi:hypothetical protein